MMWTAAWRASGQNRGADVGQCLSARKARQISSYVRLIVATLDSSRGEPVTKIGGRRYSAWLGLVPPLRWALIATERRG